MKKRILSIGFVVTLFLATGFALMSNDDADAIPAGVRWCGEDLDDEWCCYDCGYGCSVPDVDLK